MISTAADGGGYACRRRYALRWLGVTTRCLQPDDHGGVVPLMPLTEHDKNLARDLKKDADWRQDLFGLHELSQRQEVGKCEMEAFYESGPGGPEALSGRLQNAYDNRLWLPPPILQMPVVPLVADASEAPAVPANKLALNKLWFEHSRCCPVC